MKTDKKVDICQSLDMTNKSKNRRPVLLLNEGSGRKECPTYFQQNCKLATISLYWLREDMHDSKREEDNIITTQKNSMADIHSTKLQDKNYELRGVNLFHS
jgi:hypothetical protein